MYDNYLHLDKSLVYIVECILGPNDVDPSSTKLIENFDSQLMNNCECLDFCNVETCKCIEKPNSVISISQKLEEFNLNKDRDLFLVECNNMCKCLPNCINRIVQKGPVDGLIVKKSDRNEKGDGLFTNKHISKGTFICEYAGELITKKQALMRQESNLLLNKMNYIFCLNEHCGEGEIYQTFVDPSIFGNIGRYINHSCEPNCVIIPVRVDKPIPKLAIFSCHNIKPGEEITFNYGSNNNISCQDKGVLNRVKCFCLAKSCTGFIPFDHY